MASLRTWVSLTGLGRLVVAVFALSLLLGLLVPIYTDEIAFDMLFSRTLIEGGRVVGLLPQCKSSFAIPLPVSWYPAAILYHLVFSKLGLLGIRIASLVVAFAWLYVAHRAIARTTTDRDARIRRLAAFVSLHALGIVPLMLVTARPEPVFVLTLAAYVAFPLAWPVAAQPTRLRRALVTGAFVVVTSVFYFSHGMSLIFTPFVLLSAALTFTWRRPGWLALALGFALFAFVQRYAQAKDFFNCPEAPSAIGVMKGLMMDPGQLRHAPGPFLREGLENLRKHTMETAESMTLEPTILRILPRWPSEADNALVKVADPATRLGIWALVVAVPLFVLVVAVRSRRFPTARRPMLLAAGLLACLAARVFLSVNWNYYHAPFVIGVLALVAALTASATVVSDATRARLARPLEAATLLLYGVALASMIATLVHVGPRLVALNRTGSMVVPGQLAEVPVFGYSAERAKIRAHAASCAIRGDGSRHLVIDDATLYAFDDLREPLHIIYVSDATMWGGDIPGKKTLDLLRGLEAPGIISRCAYFPTALVERARRAGDYCCVPASDFEQLR